MKESRQEEEKSRHDWRKRSRAEWVGKKTKHLDKTGGKNWTGQEKKI